MKKTLIILAAGQGTRLRPLTDQQPKCLVPVAGKPILTRVLDVAKTCGIRDVVVVGGYFANQLQRFDVKLVLNPAFDRTNMVRSLFCAEAHFGDGFVLSYGDIFYRPDVLSAVCEADEPIAVAVDQDWEAYWKRRFEDPLLDAETLRMQAGRIVEIGGKPNSIGDIQSQYIGLLGFDAHGVQLIREALRTAEAEEAQSKLSFGRALSVDAMYMTDFLQGIIDRGVRVAPVPIHGGWAEIDSLADLALAEQLIKEGRFGNLAESGGEG